MGALGLLLGMTSLLTTHTLESEAETITNTLGAADVKENFLFVIQPQGQMQTKGRQKGWGLQADFKSCFALIASVERPGVRHLQAVCDKVPCPYPILSSTVGGPVTLQDFRALAPGHLTFLLLCLLLLCFLTLDSSFWRKTKGKVASAEVEDIALGLILPKRSEQFED